MRLAQLCFSVVVGLSTLLVSGPTAGAQPEDDEFRSGLIGSYRAARLQFERVDDRIAFSAGAALPDHRLGKGSFQATWRGYLMSQAPGDYRLYAHVAGQVVVKLDGQVILESKSIEPKWCESEPLELQFDFHPLEISYKTSGPQTRLALFWSGPQFQLEPIGTKQFYHDPDQTPDDRFEQGHALTTALRCGACHKLAGQSAVIAGPSLEYLAHVRPRKPELAGPG